MTGKRDDNNHILREKKSNESSGIILPGSVLKDQIKFAQDMSVVDPEKRRVKDRYVGDPSVDPLWKEHQDILRNAGKERLPEPHVFLSRVNFTARKVIARLVAKGKKPNQTMASRVVAIVVSQWKKNIRDDFEIKEEIGEELVQSAFNFWKASWQDHLKHKA